MAFAPPVTPSPDAELQRNLVQYQTIAEDLRVTIAQTDIIRRQIEGLQSQMLERRAAVGRLAAASYRSHRADAFNLLLDAGSATDFRDRLALLDVFAQHRQLEIKALNTTVDRYASAQRTLDALIAQQRGQQQELLTQRRKIEARLAELRSPPSP
jgi:septal ring factor EnvC (AmiA/AmiB activator)